MKKLKSVEDRISNPSSYEVSQRISLEHLLNKTLIPDKSKGLSVSVGDGTWDYFILKNKLEINKVVATDIVDNPVEKSDVGLLSELADWKFKKVKADKKLPFDDKVFDIVWHFDVAEHVEKPFLFFLEQYRILKKGGYVLFNTPNLLRLTNILSLFIGKLYFPKNIGFTEGIGDYIHIQEFTEWNLVNYLKEIGFKDVEVDHSYWGIHPLNVKFSDRPKSQVGKLLSQYLTVLARK